MIGKQNINLLSSLSIKPSTKYTAQYLLKIVSVFFLFLILIYTIFWSYTTHKKSVLHSLMNEKTATIDAIAVSTASRLFEPGKASPDYPHGFSPYLLALANIVPEGVWLQNITFAGGNNITFAGETFDANLITAFINALNQDTVINGVFNAFAVTKPAVDKNDKSKAQGVMRFNLGTISESKK